MRNILITGGSGLVGNGIKFILKTCNKYDNYNFIFMSSKDCDLTDYNQTYKYFSNVKPDYVIHLAAKVGGLFCNMNFKVDMFLENIAINNNVLKVCHELNVKKVVSCLSTCIFPDKTSYPINENMLHNGPPHTSNDAYAYAKRMVEVLSNAYNEQYGHNFICVIPTNIYGPFDNFNLQDSHVIPGLIHKCYLAKQNNQPFIVSGTGKPLRQFIHAEDLGKLILWTLFDYNLKETIILSPSEESEVSIKDIALKIAENFNYDNIIFDETKSDGQFKKTADNSKLLSLINNFEFKNIYEGIKETVTWFIDNYQIARK
jgi:GDP-L-fucose synthase